MKLLRKIAAYMLSACISLPVMNAEAFSPRAESPPSYQLDNEMVMESNSMEKLLMEAAETNTENSDESTNSYSSCVTSIDMENGYADISFSCTQDALLITALYDEASGKMITSAQAEVTPSQNDAALYFDVMPEDYFIIRSYLVDPLDNAPLSEELESDIYTQEQQEFYHLTPEDFPEELVWQEDTASNNFAVFDENAVIVRYTEGHNILTKNDDTGIIIIQNADDAVKNLSENNALILFTEENTPVLLKADTVTVEENTVTMTEKEAALEDFFEIIRIHSGWVEPDFSEVEFGNGVTVTQDISAQNLMARSNIMAHSSNTEFNFNRPVRKP